MAQKLAQAKKKIYLQYLQLFASLVRWTMMRVFLNINVDQSSPRGKTWPLQQPSTVDHLVEQVLVFEKDSISQK